MLSTRFKVVKEKNSFSTLEGILQSPKFIHSIFIHVFYTDARKQRKQFFTFYPLWFQCSIIFNESTLFIYLYSSWYKFLG